MAFAFNGTSQALTLATFLASDYPATLCGRFRPERDTASEAIMAQRSTSALQPIFGSISYRGDIAGDLAQLATRNNSNSLNTVNSSIAPTLGDWNFCAVVLSSSTSRSLYLNQNAADSSSSTLAGPFSVTRFSVGAQFVTGGTLDSYFQGQACEVAVWNVALNADEIGSLAKGYKPSRIRPHSLVFYDRLLRNLQDIRGALTLTNNNSATVANHPRVY